MYKFLSFLLVVCLASSVVARDHDTFSMSKPLEGWTVNYAGGETPKLLGIYSMPLQRGRIELSLLEGEYEEALARLRQSQPEGEILSDWKGVKFKSRPGYLRVVKAGDGSRLRRTVVLKSQYPGKHVLIEFELGRAGQLELDRASGWKIFADFLENIRFVNA